MSLARLKSRLWKCTDDFSPPLWPFACCIRDHLYTTVGGEASGACFVEHQNESKISRVSTRLLIFIFKSLVVFKKLSKGRQGMAATKKPTVGAQFKVSYTIFLKILFLLYFVL